MEAGVELYVCGGDQTAPQPPGEIGGVLPIARVEADEDETGAVVQERPERLRAG